MPIDYKKYPKNWPNIRAVVLARAGEERMGGDGIRIREAKCEECGVVNRVWYHRLGSGEVDQCSDDGGQAPEEKCPHCWEQNNKPVKIILTVAHLDHDTENDDVCVTRLRALCQKCHLAYDAPMRAMHRDKKRGQAHLFPMEA